jgi:hypothetical protein
MRGVLSSKMHWSTELLLYEALGDDREHAEELSSPRG